METPKSVEFFDTKYIREDLAGAPVADGPWTLFIIDNGWILIGKDDGHTEEGGRRIIDPWCVRRFGDGDGITAITDPDKCTYDKWPGDVTVIDKGRTLSVTALPGTFDGPA